MSALCWKAKKAIVSPNFLVFIVVGSHNIDYIQICYIVQLWQLFQIKIYTI